MNFVSSGQKPTFTLTFNYKFGFRNPTEFTKPFVVQPHFCYFKLWNSFYCGPVMGIAWISVGFGKEDGYCRLLQINDNSLWDKKIKGIQNAL